MLYDVLFVAFAFFAYNQLHSSFHSTGSSQTMPKVFRACGLISMILSILYLVYCSTSFSALHAIFLVTVSLIIIVLFGRINAELNKRKLKKEGQSYSTDIEKQSFIWVLERQCDVTITVLSLIGLVVNVAILIIYFITR